MNQKQGYTAPKVEVVEVEARDLLTVSGGFSGEDEDLLSL